MARRLHWVGLQTASLHKGWALRKRETCDGRMANEFIIHLGENMYEAGSASKAHKSKELSSRAGWSWRCQMASLWRNGHVKH